MKERVDEHDMTKKILSSIRESQRESQKESLLEFKNASDLNNMDGIAGALKNFQPQEEDPNASLNKTNQMGDEGEDTIDPSQEEMNAEYDKFSDVVNPRVQFKVFKIYPKANNVILGGTFQGMSGLEWQFSLEDENGLYITVNNLQVDNDVIQTLQKLKGYYDNWANEWSKKLATEYKNNSNFQ